MLRRILASVIISGLVAILVAIPGARAHPPSITTSAEAQATREEIAAFRSSIAEAITTRDAARLRKMYAETFVHTHTSGKMDGRDARIVTALAGDPVIETAAVTDLVIRVPTGWTAIATGTSPIRSLADGKTYLVQWTVTYVRGDTSWLIAASHATRAGDVKP
jgi:hypothetical protein